MLARTGRWLGHPQAPQTLTPEHLRSAAASFGRHYAANGTELVVDYHHGSLRAPRTGEAAPAAGWVPQVELRADDTELWGRVLWTSEAAGRIARGELRYLSPVLRFDAPDRLTGEPVPLTVHSAALTNTPFLTELEGLAAPAPARDPGPAPEEAAMLVNVNTLLDLPPDAPARATADAVRALKEGARDDQAVRIVDDAVRDGKVPPAHRAFYLAAAAGDPEAARRAIDALPAATRRPVAGRRPGVDAAPGRALTQAEDAIRRQLGLSPKTFLNAVD